MDQLPSKLLQQAVDEMSSMPGIGRKTALRLVINLLKRDKDDVHRFAQSFVKLRDEILYCERCNNISDERFCTICLSKGRDESIICVVEDIRDLIAIEQTQHYKGLYHVLGGIISPMDGIGPGDLAIDMLMERIDQEEIKEIIMALPSSMEGDMTNFYIFKRLQNKSIVVSSIARGVSVGTELEYADEVTLGRSILNRLPLENTIALKK